MNNGLRSSHFSDHISVNKSTYKLYTKTQIDSQVWNPISLCFLEGFEEGIGMNLLGKWGFVFVGGLLYLEKFEKEALEALQ